MTQAVSLAQLLKANDPPNAIFTASDTRERLRVRRSELPLELVARASTARRGG
jgi:hypothetical protein